MKSKKILSKALISTLILLSVIIFPFLRVGATGENGYESYNLHRHNYYLGTFKNQHNYGNVSYSYMLFSSGNPVRIEALNDEGEVLVEYYSSDYKLQSTKRIPFELPIFGGFYCGRDAYYIMYGRENKDSSDDRPVVSVVKYDFSWNEIARKNYYEIYTTIPFDGGSADFTETDDKLFIRTCHIMPNGHQSNMTFEIYSDDMSGVYAYCMPVSNRTGYVSHSFNQFIRTDGDKIVSIDHGDGEPRAILLKSFSDGYVRLLNIPGGMGENYTGTTVGGFELSSNNYLVPISRVAYDENFNENVVRNVSLLIQPKDDFNSEDTKEIAFTSYAEGSGNGCGNPYLVKVNDNLFVLMWEDFDTTDANIYSAEYTGKFKAVVIDENGNKLSDITTFEGALSDCKPVVKDNLIYWYTTGIMKKINDWGYTISNSDPLFYELKLNQNGNKYNIGIDFYNEHLEYKVKHYKENSSGSYSLEEEESFVAGKNEKVSPDVKTYEGFITPPKQTVSIEKDGTTVVEYYYDRNSYNLKWNLDGGKASNTYTTGSVKYGAQITAPNPTREGYIFSGWDKEIPNYMPAKDLTIKAKWELEPTLQMSLSQNNITVSEGDIFSLGYHSYTKGEKVTWSIINERGEEIDLLEIEPGYTSHISIGDSPVYFYSLGSEEMKLIAVRPGKATITVKMGDISDKCEITVKGENAKTEEQVKAFVRRFYTIILKREKVNEEEIEYYTSRLLSHEIDGCTVARGFVMSPEYTNKKEPNDIFVDKMYSAFFNREADDAQFYINLLESGQTREVVLAGFVNSPEFKNLCAEYGINPGELVIESQNNNQENNQGNQGNNQSDDVTKLNLDTSNVDPDKLDEYVRNLYLKILGRQYDESGLQYWKEQIMAGTTYDAATAARVGFFESEEYKNKNKSNQDFVIDCYHAFLGREPEPDGLTYWTEKLDSGEYSKQKVIDLGFGHSEEFKNILRGCGFVIVE